MAATAGTQRAKRAEVAQRRAQAVRLRTDGKTWQAIADELGYATPAAACNDVTRAMEAAIADMKESAEVLRTRELARLDMLHDAAIEVLARFHVTVSGGTIVREGEPVIDPETGEAVIAPGSGEPLLDDSPVLAAIDRLIKIGESRRRLMGLDSPVKVETGGNVRVVLEGVEIDKLT